MIKVYVWPFLGKDEAWGHASMHVGTTYISYWPSGNGRVGSKVHQDVYSAHPIVSRTLQDDIDAEGGQRPRPLLINGLDEKRIITWWHQLFPASGRLIGPPSVPWSSLNWNCSKVVANGLKEGGGDRFASWIKSWNVVWTPNDVREYAESIIRGMA
jgi:hypothetical protein